MKIYYKVVKPDLRSARRYEDDLVVCYKVGEWVKPKKEYTDLFVFDNLSSAKCFAYKNGEEYIYECHVLNPRKKGNFGLQVLKRIIQLRKAKKKWTHIVDYNAPRGTVFCSAVKLIKKVENV